jgi:hypothetical protein
MNGASVPFCCAWTARSPKSRVRSPSSVKTATRLAAARRQRLTAICASAAEPEPIHTVCLINAQVAGEDVVLFARHDGLRQVFAS